MPSPTQPRTKPHIYHERVVLCPQFSTMYTKMYVVQAGVGDLKFGMQENIWGQLEETNVNGVQLEIHYRVMAPPCA